MARSGVRFCGTKKSRVKRREYHRLGDNSRSASQSALGIYSQPRCTSWLWHQCFHSMMNLVLGFMASTVDIWFWSDCAGCPSAQTATIKKIYSLLDCPILA